MTTTGTFAGEKGICLEDGGKGILGRLHQAAMKGCGDRQHDGPLGAAFFGQRDGPLDRRRRARDNGLFRTIEVRWFDGRAHLTRGILANGDHCLRCHAQNGGHGSLTCGHSLLHQLPAAAHRACGGGKLDRAGSDVGGVLAQRVSGKIIRGDSSLGQNPECGHGYGKDRRLGELGQPKLLFGSVKAELCQVEAKRVVGFLKGLARDGKGLRRGRGPCRRFANLDQGIEKQSYSCRFSGLRA